MAMAQHSFVAFFFLSFFLHFLLLASRISNFVYSVVPEVNLKSEIEENMAE